MDWKEYILIIGGVSLDIFATMECQGSVVAKIEKKGLAYVCLMIALWQAAALFIGSFFAAFLVQKDGIAQNEVMLGNGIAVAIFAGLGVHLLIKAIQNERIVECREEGFCWQKILRGMAGTGAYTLLAGIAFGLVGTDMRFVLSLLCSFAVVMVITGAYTGYHFGFEQKTKAYGMGALLLWSAGMEIFLRRMIVH